MPAKSFTSRVLRLQFSLRALLLFTLLVGVAISIYRWPWVETRVARQWDRDFFEEQNNYGDEYATKKSGRWESEWYLLRPVHMPTYFGYKPLSDPEYKISTTYRRGWNGKPQRHGLQQTGLLSSPRLRKYFKHRYYVDDDLRLTVVYDNADRIVFSERRLNGLPHGEYRNTASTERDVGRYQHGKRVAIWQTSYALTYHLDSERVEVEKSYQKGVLHGTWIWRTPQGRVLQTAKYDLGQLIEWNGLPTQEALKRLLKACELTDESQLRLLQERSGFRFKAAPIKDSLRPWYLLDRDDPALSIYAHEKGPTDCRDPAALDSLALSPDESPLQTVLEMVLIRNETLVVREKRVFLSRVSAANLPP